MGKFKDDELGNVPSTPLSYLFVLSFNYGSLRPRYLFPPHKTKKRRLILIRRKRAGLLEPSRGQWLPVKEK